MRQVHLEEYLRRALIEEAQGVKPAPDMTQKIRAAILGEKEKGGIILSGTRLFDRLFPGQPVWKTAVAGTLCGALLVSGLTFGFSPQSRAWAKDLIISPVISIVYRVVRTEDGYSIVKSQKGKDHSGNGGAMFDGLEKVEVEVKEAKRSPEFSTAAEAQAYVGFPVHLPAYLPEGYELDSITGNTWKNSDKGFVNAVYSGPGEAGKRLLLTITNERNFLRGGDAVKMVKVQGKTAYWAEVPSVKVNGEGKEPSVKVGHQLKWTDGLLVYVLHDNTGELSLEAMLKIAESVEPTKKTVSGERRI